MTLNEAVNVLRRYSDYRRERDRRPMQESFPDVLTMIVPVAIDVLLVHMSAATPIAYCDRCVHYDAGRCLVHQVGQCRMFEAIKGVGKP